VFVTTYDGRQSATYVRTYERTMGDDDDETTTTTTTTTTGEQRQPPGVQEESKEIDDVKSHAAEEDEPLNNNEDDDAEDDDEDYEYYGRRYDDEDATTTTTNDDAAYAAAYAAYIAQVQAHAQQQVRRRCENLKLRIRERKKLNFWNPFFTWMTMAMPVLRARTHTCGISIRVSSRSRFRKLR
jgi:hypothetical protein